MAGHSYKKEFLDEEAPPPLALKPDLRGEVKLRYGSEYKLPFDADQPIGALALADFVNIASQRLSDITKGGYIHRNEHGKYPLRASIRAYCEFMRAEARRKTKGELAGKVQEAKLKGIELDLQEREANLVDVQEVKDVYEELCGFFHSVVSGVAAKCTDDLDQRRKIDRILHGAVDEAVSRFEQAGSLARVLGKAEVGSGDDA